MALANIAPIEKTENLIYSVFPISLATWYASTLSLSDPLIILGAIIAVSSFLTLLLYELPFDKWMLNALLRRRTRNRQSIIEAILIFNLMDRRWEKELKTVEEYDGDLLQKDTARQVSISVNSPYIRSESWRVRASLWLIPSLYFVITAGGNYIQNLPENQTSLLDSIVRLVLSNGASLPLIWIGISITILVAAGFRHRNLTSHIDHLSRYSYLERLIDLQNLEQRKLSVGNIPEIQKLLVVLPEILKSGDLGLFLDRWDGIYRWIHRETVARVNDEMRYYMVQPIADYYEMKTHKRVGNTVDESGSKARALLQLDWVCYFYEKINDTKMRRSTKREYVLPLPDFSEDYDSLHKRLSSADINIDDYNLLLTYNETPLSLTGKSVGAATVWAFSYLKSLGKTSIDHRQEEGLRLILRQYETNEFNLTLEEVAKLVFSAFAGDGIGLSLSLTQNDVNSLKGLKQFTNAETIDNWTCSVVRLIAGLDEEGLRKFIEDGNFIIEAGKAHRCVLGALEEVYQKHNSPAHLRELIRRIKA